MRGRLKAVSGNAAGSIARLPKTERVKACKESGDYGSRSCDGEDVVSNVSDAGKGGAQNVH